MRHVVSQHLQDHQPAEDVHGTDEQYEGGGAKPHEQELSDDTGSDGDETRYVRERGEGQLQPSFREA